MYKKTDLLTKPIGRPMIKKEQRRCGGEGETTWSTDVVVVSLWWVVVGNWGWMVGGSRWFVVDSVWVISFIEVLIRRAQKSLEIRAKYVARKIARFDAGAVVVANALSGRCWCCFHWWLWGCGGVCANPSTMTLLVYHHHRHYVVLAPPLVFIYHHWCFASAEVDIISVRSHFGQVTL